MNEKNVLSNLIWRFSERFLAKGISLLVQIILARLLAPEVFGTVAIVMTITTVLQVFVDSGFGTALIQKKEADDLDFSSVFYFNMASCLLLYGILLPFAVILSLPAGIMGAFVSQKIAGLENNIYFQIALVMLVGLLAKNAILIVEFALQSRKHGKTVVQAAVEGAKARLRPILMTSFAFILGLMPLVFAQGVGVIGNRSIATGA